MRMRFINLLSVLLLMVLFSIVPSGCGGGGGGGGGGNPDPDGDGFTLAQGDCNNADPLEFPGQEWFEDIDDDGYTTLLSWGTPNDTDCIRPLGYKAAVELLSTSDFDCDDDSALEKPNQAWYVDADGDLYPASLTATAQCARPADSKAASELAGLVIDCNDAEPNANPGLNEICSDLIDNDCDTAVDEVGCISDFDGDGSFTPADCNDNDPLEKPGQQWYVDADDDLYPASLTITTQCLRPADSKAASELASLTIDCDDTDPLEFPGQVWYVDADGDLYPESLTITTQCLRPADSKAASELASILIVDCNDSQSLSSPGILADVCADGIDNNCNGVIDEVACETCQLYLCPLNADNKVGICHIGSPSSVNSHSISGHCGHGDTLCVCPAP